MRKLNRTGKTFTTVVAAAAVVSVFASGAAVAGGLVTSHDIKNNTIKSKDVHDNGLKGKDVRDGSLTGDDIADYSLSNQDVGVLFAQVNANATVANSSGGVTAHSTGLGTYEVDFGRDVSMCAATASVGNASPGGAQGIVTQVTDRSANPQGVWVRTSDEADPSTDQDLPFQLIVVC